MNRDRTLINYRNNALYLTAAKTLLSFLCLSLSLLAAAQQQTQVVATATEQVTTEAAKEQRKPADAEAWLKRLAQSSSTLNYQISFVLLKPDTESKPYLWRHGVMADGVEMEQMSLLNGPGREMVRRADIVSYFEADVAPYSLQTKWINGPIPGRLLFDPLSLTDSYDFVLVGRSRIAGRLAMQIRVVSRDKSRFGYNLWLDKSTGLLLKMNMVDMGGQLLEQLQVTELVVTAQPDPVFLKLEQAAMPEVINLPHISHRAEHWKLQPIPLGMKVVRRDIHRLPLTGELVGYSMLSDGLIDVSIYIQPLENAIDGEVLLRHNANTLLTRRLGDFQITVIGNLPAKTANAIASAVVLLE